MRTYAFSQPRYTEEQKGGRTLQGFLTQYFLTQNQNGTYRLRGRVSGTHASGKFVPSLSSLLPPLLRHRSHLNLARLLLLFTHHSPFTVATLLRFHRHLPLLITRFTSTLFGGQRRLPSLRWHRRQPSLVTHLTSTVLRCHRRQPPLVTHLTSTVLRCHRSLPSLDSLQPWTIFRPPMIREIRLRSTLNQHPASELGSPVEPNPLL